MEQVLALINQLPPGVWPGVRIVLVLLLAWWALRLFRRLTNTLESRDMLGARGKVVWRGVIRGAIVLLAGLLILEQLGVSTATVWASLSAVAVLIAVGFIAVWSVLSNALCGLLLLVYAPFRVGDDIELVDLGSVNALRGRVADMNLMFVQVAEILERDGEQVEFLTQIPNNHFFQRGIRRRQRQRSTTPLVDSFTVGRGQPEAGAVVLKDERVDESASTAAVDSA